VAEDGITSRTYRISVLLEALQLPTPTPDKSGNPFFSSLEDLLKENEVSPDGTKGGYLMMCPGILGGRVYSKAL